MARIRTIKPEFFTSLTIAELSTAARLTFIGLWTYVDDHGRGIDDARLVKAAVWPLDVKKSERVVAGLLGELERHGRIDRYTVDGRAYLCVTNWREHQRIDKPQKAKHPGPFPEHSGNVPGTLPPNGGGEGKGTGNREGNRDRNSSSSVVAHQNPDEDESLIEQAKAAAQVAYQAEAARTRIVNPQAWLDKALENELIRLRLDRVAFPAKPLCGECDNGNLVTDSGDVIRCACRVAS